MKFKKLSDMDFEKVIIREKKPAILVFGADWSGSSSMMDNIMERISEDLEAQIQIYRVDIEGQTDISNFFGIQTVPTTVMLKDGEVVDLIKGLIPASRMRSKIKEIFAEA